MVKLMLILVVLLIVSACSTDISEVKIDMKEEQQCVALSLDVCEVNCCTLSPSCELCQDIGCHSREFAENLGIQQKSDSKKNQKCLGYSHF